MTITPPTTGPKIGATTTIIVAIAAARPSRSRPAARVSIVVSNGHMTPAAAPWTRRNTIRLAMSHAAPASTEPTRNTARQHSHTRLLPKRSDTHWASGIAIPIASR